jgi:hypothetical protein
MSLQLYHATLDFQEGSLLLDLDQYLQAEEIPVTKIAAKIATKPFKVLQSVTRSQLDGIEEHIKDGGVGVEELRKKPDGKEDIENRFAIPVMPHQDSDYTLSEERSRRRIDSDRVSETDTIVPRRNLSILDVAALILNKMVIFSWTYTILGIA